MAEERQRDDNMDFLSRAIVDAITKSPEVRQAIKKLAEKDEGYARSFMVLMLKVRNLAETLGVEISGVREEAAGEDMFDLDFIGKRSERDRSRVDLANFVDGRKESLKEAQFREFESSRFNQEQWLKKHGLIF
jgi:hydroxylamine reductase (hybrid-cluster protein)